MTWLGRYVQKREDCKIFEYYKRFLLFKKSRDIRSKRAEKWRQNSPSRSTGEGLREAVVNITLETFKRRKETSAKSRDSVTTASAAVAEEKILPKFRTFTAMLIEMRGDGENK